MALVVWSTGMSVGIPAIDVQHKKLLCILNDLYTAVGEGVGFQAVFTNLSDLVSFASYHFEYEENMLQEMNYPDLEEHKLEHAELTKKLIGLCEKFKEGQSNDFPREMLEFLVAWFMNHTLSFDKKYAEYIAANGAA